MFNKILIANRGEIACRVIDTARKMGVETLAVYSDADAGARHVQMADAAVHIGGSSPAESYLKGDVIIAAALENGAQAIHPGYGFLSENPEFVDMVKAAGLVFIGPSADAIRAMGLKDAAKVLMEKAGVPVVPGYHGKNQDSGRLEVEAGDIGYPVLIKAVAGGGGKGMRLVERPQDFLEALSSARAEATTAFGNNAVLVEKFVEKPRHIEIQVFGDGTNAVHLFERDCSLQRRHQKVIEEAPAPGMTEEMRAAMGAAAVLAAQAIGYAGAGTIEFIVDASDGLRPDRFWFMEMNTRLQVEHPVTEAVTGIDLVEWQLRVAAGEVLPKSQDQLELNGHAFEARLYAEDVPKGFLPATGTLTHLQFAPDCRADTGVRAGDVISPFYDPMIAKIIVHGATRELALSRLRAAISGTQVAGTVTNLTFLGKLARDTEFSIGDVDTGLIGRNIEVLSAAEPASSQVRASAVLAAADLGEADDGFAIWTPMEHTIALIEDEPFTGKLTVLGPDTVVVELADEAITLPRRGLASMQALKIGDTVSVFGTEIWHFDIPDPLAVGTEVGGGNLVEAPMPGLVKGVFAQAGQVVTAGDRLAILEAMKMEHTLAAPRDGIVAEVLVSEGTQVEAGAPLVRLEDEE
ncbi:MAG: acetyl/propionyl/methylcrotonyl-CoA carboxylase subunit alpha [Marinosulfonomonas sp.]|nr:acetyl/propionyl/methylcrotonyl-CoA carboxylase subunit alpha [Marinosulfonomonas sp.]